MSKIKNLVRFKKLLLVVPAFLIFFLPGRIIKIARIDCQSQYLTCPEDLIAKLKLAEGKSYSQAKATINRELTNDLLVTDYQIQYRFPQTLMVDILLRKASFALQNRGTNFYYLVNDQGDVLAEVSSTNLPYIINDTSYEIGDKVTQSDLLALKLVGGVFAMYQVGKGEKTNETLVIEMPTQKKVLFPLDGDRDSLALLGALRLIYSQNENYEIDLRFKNPILR